MLHTPKQYTAIMSIIDLNCWEAQQNFALCPRLKSGYRLKAKCMKVDVFK